MYLHLGNDILVKKNKVVAIIDLEIATAGKVNKTFLDKLKENKVINYVSGHGKEKTLIITSNEYYLSPISSMTLLKRS